MTAVLKFTRVDDIGGGDGGGDGGGGDGGGDGGGEGAGDGGGDGGGYGGGEHDDDENPQRLQHATVAVGVHPFLVVQ